MKRTVFVILILSLAMGIPLMVFDFLYRGESEFRVPEDMEQLVVDLDTADRTEELLLERDLIMPSMVELFMQSDTEGLKRLKLVSEGELLGRREPRVDFFVQRYTQARKPLLSASCWPRVSTPFISIAKGKRGSSPSVTAKPPWNQRSLNGCSKSIEATLSNPPVGYRRFIPPIWPIRYAGGSDLQHLPEQRPGFRPCDLYFSDAGDCERRFRGQHVQLPGACQH